MRFLGKIILNFWKKWKAGKTGFPIVDAGMRELNATGFMHNRVENDYREFPHQTFAYRLANWRSLILRKN